MCGISVLNNGNALGNVMGSRTGVAGHLHSVVSVRVIITSSSARPVSNCISRGQLSFMLAGNNSLLVPRKLKASLRICTKTG